MSANPTTNPDPELERLTIVRQYSASATSLAEACRLATLLCHRPASAVELVLDDSVVIPAAAGLRAGRVARAHAPGAQVLGERALVVVQDARIDPRFAQLRLVEQPRGIRFYAAVPLISPEGHALGVLSVWDHEVGDLTPSQAESLKALGRLVMDQLNLGRRQRELERLEEEHARVDQALREAEAKFRGIFENTVVGIYQTTAEGRYLSANPMLARIYGYASPDELMGAVGNIESEIYVDDGARERFTSALQQADTLTNFEARIRRKDGSVIWIAENARVVRDEQGRVKYYEGTVQDITARKRAEERLRNSEMLYHSLVEELPQNIFRKDLEERFIFANTRFCQTVGRSWDEIQGGTDFDLFPAEMAEKYQRDDQRVVAEGRTLRATEANITPDGETHWVEVVKTPLRDLTGAITGIQGIFWDVTETKRLQDALAYERDLLQALLDHSPDSIYFKDSQARFLKAGRALARRFNIADPEQLVGKTAFDLLDPKLAAEVYAEEQKLLRTGTPLINKVEELVDNQGGRSWASVTKVPIYDRSGQIFGLVGVARDITQLIEAEQALRDAEEKYRTIFENSVEGIFQTTADGKFLQGNPSLARIYGYTSPTELVDGLTDVRTQVYVQPGRREEFVREVMEKGSITGFESEIRRRDGSTTWVSESARAVRDRAGKLAYFEGTIEDVSARKQAEAERERARQAAEESARMKAEFVATVSHEIRTPLNAIIPSTERLVATRLDRQQRYLVESIDHGAHMLLQIVNDILEVSRIEAGAVRLEVIEFDLHDVVERAVSFFASPAHAKRLELIANLRPGLPRKVRGDPARLGQILNNLLGNAVKFTDRGEIVVEVAATGAGGGRWRVEITVRDTGIGIASEARSRVFVPFAQADGSMARRYGGTGLGLTISRRFVELMGGHIDFESQLGKGTVFRFDLSLEAVAEAESAGEAPGPGPGVLAGRRVLILDDNATQRAVIGEFVGALGAGVVLATGDVGQALEELRDGVRSGRPLDLILFDAELPGSDLVQTARRLRAGGATSGRLVAMIAPGAAADDRGLAAAGVCGTLVKPLRQTRLASELAAVLHGQPETVAGVDSATEEAEGPWRGLVVLLVEDNPLNQRVAGELLRHFGVEVDAAMSGLEALDAVARRRYDLVLMDCQMPDMDGYETTRRIREYEAATGAGTRVPIVALSANALAGDRETGLAAGMDDYLTKPLRQPELARLLRQIANREGTATATGAQPAPVAAPESVSASTSPASSPAEAVGGAGGGGGGGTVGSDQGSDPEDVPVLDPVPLEALASPDDPAAAREFIQEYLVEAPRRLDRIRAAVAAGNASSVRAEAHSLKGNSSYMGARRLVRACAELEDAARAGDLSAATPAVAAIEREMESARVALIAFGAGLPGRA